MDMVLESWRISVWMLVCAVCVDWALPGLSLVYYSGMLYATLAILD